ncbi:MAG TPA: hypothetical protein VGI35_00150 [Steroidobacteraceae bacterium]|jgi:hypothetical protein
MQGNQAEPRVTEPHGVANRDTTIRNLRTILALAALFVLPVAGSFWLYYGASWRPAGHVNRGELIRPARPLPDVPLPIVGSAGVRGAAANVFSKRWALVYVGDGGCDRRCQYALYVTRQTWLALNRDASRVERVFLATGNCCAATALSNAHGLIVQDASVSSGRELLAAFPREDREEMIFLVDPLGNLMMRYDLRRDPKGLLQDLRLLLQLSHIG